MADVAAKYAESLFEVSRSENVQDSVFADLKEITKAVKGNEAFHQFSENPRVSIDERQQFIKKTFNGTDKPLMNLLMILGERQNLELIPAITDAYEKLFNEEKSQQYMKVESVYALTNDELDAIGEAFIKRTGYKKLLIENIINKDLIGGIRATIGTTVYDGSVQNELKQLEKSFHQQ